MTTSSGGFLPDLIISPMNFCWCWFHECFPNERNETKNKLAKLGDAIAVSKSETMNDSLTDWPTDCKEMLSHLKNYLVVKPRLNESNPILSGVEQAELRHTSHCCSTIIITIIITIMITIIITITTITITWVEQAELQHTSHRKSRVRGLGNSKKKKWKQFRCVRDHPQQMWETTHRGRVMVNTINTGFGVELSQGVKDVGRGHPDWHKCEKLDFDDIDNWIWMTLVMIILQHLPNKLGYFLGRGGVARRGSYWPKNTCTIRYTNKQI